MNALKSWVLGFIAVAIAAVTVQEGISWIFVHYWTGWYGHPWSTMEVRGLLFPNIHIPWIAAVALTGGLWGALFGLILGGKPEGMLTIRGAILGLFGPGLIAGFIAIPYLSGWTSPLLDGNVSVIVPILCISAGFGAAAAWLYGLFSHARLP